MHWLQEQSLRKAEGSSVSAEMDKGDSKVEAVKGRSITAVKLPALSTISTRGYYAVRSLLQTVLHASTVLYCKRKHTQATFVLQQRPT